MDRRIGRWIGPVRRALSVLVCGENLKTKRACKRFASQPKDSANMPVNIFRPLVVALLLTLLVLIPACGPKPAGPSTASTGVANPTPAAQSADEIALLEAAIKGDTAAVKTLLDKGVNPNTRDGDG